MTFPSASEPATSPGAWQACPNDDKGRHHWERSKAHGYYHCTNCGVLSSVLRQANGQVAPPGKPPCPKHTTGKHRWGPRPGNGPHRCAACGLAKWGPMSKRKRENLERCFRRDGPGCFYCRCPLATEDARLDHFVPRSKGGADALANRRAACGPCDKRKADQMPWEFDPQRFPPPN